MIRIAFHSLPLWNAFLLQTFPSFEEFLLLIFYFLDCLDFLSRTDVKEFTLMRMHPSIIYGADMEDCSFEMNENGAREDDNVIVTLQNASQKIVDKVEFSELQIKVLPDSFWNCHHLVLINLSHNQLEVIPDSIGGFQQLEKLYLSSNQLEKLPHSIGLLINLKILDVSCNKLNALPETIGGCRSLVDLDASFNNLMHLPTNIGNGLVNLQKLSIQLNRILSLPTSIGEMKSLRYLDAHFNQLHNVPSEIGRITTLEVLNLSKNFNDLTEIPESIGNLTKLRELDIGNNQIQLLPHTFYKLDCLEKLNLQENPLVFPPIEFVNKEAQYVREFIMKEEIDSWRRETYDCLKPSLCNLRRSCFTGGRATRRA